MQTRHQALTLVSLVLLVLLVACSGEETSPNDAPTSGGLKTTPLVTISPEGGFCGGFTTEDKQKQCAPGLFCATPPMVSDASGICSLRPNVESLLVRPELYLGRTVTLAKAFIRPGIATCDTVCDAGHCLESCQAPMVVVPSVDALPTAGSLVLRGGDGTPLGCVIESDGSAHCDLEPASWFLTGRVVALDGGSHALDLQRKSPLYFD